jgi:hypothetical protein
LALSNVPAGRRLRASELNAIIDKVNALAIPPQCRVRRNATQNITTGGAAQKLSFDTEDVDTDAMFAPTSTDVTIKTAGKYQAIGGGTIGGASGLKTWEVTKNGTIVRNAATTGPDTASQAGRTQVVVEFTAAVNDVICLQVFQNSGGTVTATGELDVRKVSD